ncbi:MAG: hypothetical protein Q9195_004812 [Heterodermia aff. obscurata]
MAAVRLPQIDLRQPEPHITAHHPKLDIAPAISESNVQQSKPSAEKSNEHVAGDLTDLNTTQAVVAKQINVRIPRFTYSPEERHASDGPATLFKSRRAKPSTCDKPGGIEGSPKSNHLSARLLGDEGSRGKRSVLNTSGPKNRAAKLTSVEQQSRSTAPETRGSRSRGKQAKKASGRMPPSMEVDEGARARSDQGPANEKERTRRASTINTPMASPQASPSTITTADSLHLASSPKVTAPPVRHNSSPRQWTDYANHTSNRSQQGSPLRSAPRRSRGGTMSRRALSSFLLHRGTIQRQSSGPVARLLNDWTSWVEAHVMLFRLSPTISTGDLWSSFHDEGNITSIEIFEDSSGSRTGKAKIKFR